MDNVGPPRQTAWPPYPGWTAREAPQPAAPAKGVEKGQRLARPKESTTDLALDERAPETGCSIGTCGDTVPLPSCLELCTFGASPLSLFKVRGHCSPQARVSEGEQYVLVSMCKAGHGGACGEHGSQGFRCPHLQGAKLVIS